jgi:hypothetical protein
MREIKFMPSSSKNKKEGATFVERHPKSGVFILIIAMLLGGFAGFYAPDITAALAFSVIPVFVGVAFRII